MILPIFPLNGAVLFPGTNLPLNIFEDRYIDMIDFALTKDRKIGMIQSNESNQIYSVGCVGKINSFNETSDGRYLISLQGLTCFEVQKEIETKKKFRSVEIRLVQNSLEENYNFSDNERSDIIDKYKSYIKVKNLNLDLAEIENIELSQLIKFIAMVSPFKNIEKQALLETFVIKDFYSKLLSLIELEIASESPNKTIN